MSDYSDWADAARLRKDAAETAKALRHGQPSDVPRAPDVVDEIKRYGALPAERLRTEVDIKAIRSSNAGCCYLKAGWTRDRIVRGKLYLYSPVRTT